MSLKARLLCLLLALAALPALLLSGVAYGNARATIEQRVRARLNAIADLKREQIQVWYADREADARLLANNFLNEEHFSVILNPAADPALQAAFAGFLTDNLLSVQQAREGYREIMFVSADGTIILSTDPARPGADLSGDAALAAVMASATGAAVHDFYWPPGDAPPEMVFGHILRRVDLTTNTVTDEAAGAVLIRVRMDETLYPLIRDWPDRGATGETLLVRTDGTETVFLNPVRFNDLPDQFLRLPSSAEQAQPAHLAAAGHDGILETTDYRGSEVLAAHRGIPQAGWGLVAKQDVTEAFAPVDALARQLAVVTVLVLAAAAITALLFSRALTGPLAALVSATRAVAAGDYAAAIPLQRPDELGALADSFRTMLAAVRDSHASLRARTEELQAFFGLSQSLLGTLDIDRMLGDALHEAISGTHSAAGAVVVVEPGTHTITIRAVAGMPRSLIGQRFPIDAHTAPGYALLRREPVSSPDLLQAGAFNVPPFILSLGIRANLAVPLLLGDEAFGAIVVDDFEPRHYSQGDVRVMQTIANQTALALGRARLFDDLSLSYDRTLDALVAALDARDKETEGHSRRVVAYTLALARSMRIAPAEVSTIRRGALLHDIGKIGVPDAILLKPGPLDEAEWTAMRRHPELGQHILAGIPFLDSAARIVYAHHERWDGLGYPRGLRGEAIPLGARLFAVADTFDAITSDRPYRKARPYAVARAEIEAGAGTQFAPPVVEAFLKIPEVVWDRLRQEARLQPVQAPAAEWAARATVPAPLAPELTTLTRLMAAVGGTLTLEPLLAESTRAMVELLGAAAAALFLYDADDDTLSLAAETGLPDSLKAAFSRFPVAGFHNERVVREGCAYVHGDLSEVEPFRALGLPAAQPDWAAYLCVPLTARGAVLGALGLFSRRPSLFEQHEVALYESLGEQIGLAIANARQHEAVQQLAATDSLTGAYNRRYLFDFLARELARCARYEHGLSILLLDVDYFKAYNDRHGHLAGDEALRQITGVLRQGLRHIDLVARVGGEEFVLVLPETAAAGAQSTAERLRAAIESHAFPHDRLTVSIGSASCRDAAQTSPDDLLKLADEALYEAKRSGRNAVSQREMGQPALPAARQSDTAG